MENTAKRDPMVHLVGMMTDGPGKYITDMEADGQRAVVASSVVPRDRGDDQNYIDLGFMFGDVVDGLFQEATLPEGWSKAGTGHDMHSDIVDERGVRRCGIFYKAAFYDRSAHMSIVNVGRDVATGFIYGDSVDLPDLTIFTPDELADAVTGCAQYLASAARNPSIYGDRAPRAERLAAALPDAGETP